MTVIVTQRLAPASAGAVVPTGQALIAGSFTATTDTAPKGPIRSVADLEAAYGTTRTGALIPLWDWLDYAFQQGLQQAYVASYGGADTIDTALALFDSSYVGQLVILGETNDDTLIAKGATNALTYNRFFAADVVSGSTLTAMQTLGDGLPVDASADHVGLFGPWINIPPPKGVSGGSERTVPASAAFCGVCARVERDGNPNRAPGGPDYALLGGTDSLTLATTESQRDTSVAHKLNLVRLVDGVFQIDSWRTGLAKDPTTPFWQINCARTRMWAQYYAAQIGRRYYGKNIDAEGHVAGALKKDLKAMLQSLYDVDALYGATPSEAFDVNTGTAVNPTSTVANAVLTAVSQMRLDLAVETTEVDLVYVPVTGAVVPS